MALYQVAPQSLGYIQDQTQLLADIRDGLQVYNQEGDGDALIAAWCDRTIRQNERVSQAPFRFRRAAEGATPVTQRSQFRLLTAQLLDYDLSVAYTRQGLQDMLPSDLAADMQASIIGDNELLLKLMYYAMFVPHASPSVVGTQMTVPNGFYNGETDVPPFRTNSFGSAHSHYAGLNTTTLATSHITSMVKDITEHGYGTTPGSLELHVNSQEIKAVLDLATWTGSGVADEERSRLFATGMIGYRASIGGAKIIQDDWVPAGYLLMLDTAVKPLICREHVNPAARGLQIDVPFEASAYPLQGAQFLRRIGFTVGLLAAGTVRQLVASTSYTNPTSSFNFA